MTNFTYHNHLENPDKFKNLNILGYGLKFCPRPKQPKKELYIKAVQDLIRRVRIHDWITENSEILNPLNEYDPRMRVPSDWCPANSATTPECQILTKRIRLESDAILAHFGDRRPSCAISKRLIRLRYNPDIKIVQTDKNLGLCVMDIRSYDDMVWIHLRDTVHYEAISMDIGYYGSPDWTVVLAQIKKANAALLKMAISSGLLSEQAKKFLSIVNTDLPKFHVLPKLHKKTRPIPSRPIIGAVNWITTNWSIYLTTVLEKIHCEFTLKNSFSLIEKLENIPINGNDFFISADVSSLYTMMNLERLYLCFEHRDLDPLHLEILKFICDNNFFRYGSRVFKQKDGIAMGFNAAVHCANIYLDGFDGHFSEFFEFYGRYIDDIFMIYRGSRSELDHILSEMNSAIHGIKLNFSISTFSIDFLDLTIFKQNDRVTFKTFQKENNIYQYIPPHSYHNPACISGFIKGELIRYVRCNTNIEDRKNICLLFYNRLLARSYSRNYLDSIFKSVDLMLRSPFKRSLPVSAKTMALVIPYYNNLVTNSLKKFIFSLNNFQFAKDMNLNFLIAFKRNANVMQLCSRSNISDTQEDLLHDLRQYGG